LAKANEATTRLLIVDEVLQALGWSKDSFNPEENVSPGSFTDYLLRVDGVPRLVVEAKRVGHTFVAGRQLRKTEYTISYAQAAFGPAFGEVLDQAKRYSVQTRVPYCLVTNGLEWLLLELLPPPPKKLTDLKCVHFGNILSRDRQFNLMWELVSRGAVTSRNPESHLAAINSVEAEYSKSPRTTMGELRWQPPLPEPAHARDFYDRFFDQIVDASRRRMLEYCFVSDSRLDQYQGDLKRTLADTAPSFLGDAQELAPADQKKVIENYSGDQEGRVVLVVGSVGAGKTTFVMKVMIEHRDSPKHVFVRLDLINEGAGFDVPSEGDLWARTREAWLSKETQAASHAELQRTFHGELERLKEGPKARLFERDENEFVRAEADLLDTLAQEPRTFLRRSWWHYRRHHGKSIILFLDNVDRASEAFQHLVYSFAHKVAAETGATVIITMRESTFYRGKENGFLDVRTNDLVFHLQSPDLIQLLSKRIKYVEKHLAEDHRIKAWRASVTWGEFERAANRFAESLKETFLKEGQPLVAILAAVAWHSARDFLRLARRLHLLIGDAHEWTEQDVVGALLFAADPDFDPEIATRLFVPPMERERGYFLKLRLLLFLMHGIEVNARRRGVAFSRLAEFSRTYGYRGLCTERAVEQLVRDRLLECMEIPAETEHTVTYCVQGSHSFRPSPLALLLLDRLWRAPSYLIAGGWCMPFHQSKALRGLAQEARQHLFLGGSLQAVDRANLGAIGLSALPRIVASYLVDASGYEMLASDHLRSFPEVGAVEERLDQYLQVLAETAGVARRQRFGTREAGEATSADAQQSLFPHDPLTDAADIPAILSLPPTVGSVRVGQSTAAPRILWVLANAGVAGSSGLTAAEITRQINKHILDDHHRVEPTNIARALRSPTLSQSTWLHRQKGPRKGGTTFSLDPGWKDVWRSWFGQEPPDI
jgi:hypothetical protein